VKALYCLHQVRQGFLDSEIPNGLSAGLPDFGQQHHSHSGCSPAGGRRASCGASWAQVETRASSPRWGLPNARCSDGGAGIWLACALAGHPQVPAGSLSAAGPHANRYYHATIVADSPWGCLLFAQSKAICPLMRRRDHWRLQHHYSAVAHTKVLALSLLV
jgi:hypothetical protein